MILGSLIVSMFTGCQQSPPKYIPQVVDSVNNDKNRMGLNGKVKTLDIYYYRPENASSVFSVKFKKGDKWEEDGIHHCHLHFNIDGNLVQYNEYDKQENAIQKIDYTYEAWGYTRTLSYPGTNGTIVRKYNTDGKLLEVVYDNLYGEINTYNDRGNLIRTKQIDGTIHKPAMIEYDYNEHDLLVEKREFYNIGELSGKTVYEYDANDLLVQTQVYDLLSRDMPETHFIYEYSDSNRVVEEYRVDGEGNKELESWCKREYYPNGKLKAVVRNGFLEEKYDEQGRPIDERPGFEILYKGFQDYDYDTHGNWIETKNFNDYVDLGTGLGRILKPYVERVFTYYEE
ncbi:hypothetical protein [Parabacteroides bouchesdurhonensis]|uniref:hypothetical protein n=1 Tax=Parabacteroides bouchesdurhonensis TaxID=1936995 RepID=UPI001F371B82|nr:hypothetical protein [Parabacteroides bouchesdurhonensis]